MELVNGLTKFDYSICDKQGSLQMEKPQGGTSKLSSLYDSIKQSSNSTPSIASIFGLGHKSITMTEAPSSSSKFQYQEYECAVSDEEKIQFEQNEKAFNSSGSMGVNSSKRKNSKSLLNTLAIGGGHSSQCRTQIHKNEDTFMMVPDLNILEFDIEELIIEEEEDISRKLNMAFDEKVSEIQQNIKEKRRNTTKAEDHSRKSTLDSVKRLESFLGLVQYFAVFDGHGGQACSTFLRDHLHKYITKAPSYGTDLHATLLEALKIAEEKFFESFSNDNSGSCVVICMVSRSKLVFANIGDCRAVLCSKGGGITISTKDHRAVDAKEKERIEAAGGFVARGRVFGLLAVSRSIGDREFKNKDISGVVISEPEVSSIDIKAEEHEFAILASDGVWDSIEAEIAAKIVRKALFEDNMSPAEAAKALVEKAVSKGSRDDVTAVVIRFVPIFISNRRAIEDSPSSCSVINSPNI
jgi:serine/threonine protein phosphatase PrpC